jgi:hypothetical protein
MYGVGEAKSTSERGEGKSGELLYERLILVDKFRLRLRASGCPQPQQGGLD